MYDVLIPKAYFVKLLENLAAMVEEQKDYLTHLDAQIGDSDHGVNLSIGFREVMKKLPDLVAQDVDIATLLKKSGMSLLSRVGGASGPLYGSLFMKLGAPVAGKNEVTFAELCEMIKSGIDAVVSRGKAELGDKTMVDALLPARDALFAGMEEGLKPLDVMEKAVAARLRRPRFRGGQGGQKRAAPCAWESAPLAMWTPARLRAACFCGCLPTRSKSLCNRRPFPLLFPQKPSAFAGIFCAGQNRRKQTRRITVFKNGS